MNKKAFYGGWALSTVVFLVLLLAIRNLQDKLDAKIDCISVQQSESSEELLDTGSILNAALPLFFADPSFDIGVGETPKDFPAYSDPTSDCGITATPAEFVEYFNKHFKNSKADQVIITAVELEDGKLRWHIRVHEK